VLTFKPDNPHGYGRIVRDDQGELLRIVEERDATTAEKSIAECCGGIYAATLPNLFEYLQNIVAADHESEHYLTDIVGEAKARNHRVYAHLSNNGIECLGINTQEQLKTAEDLLAKRDRTPDSK
jgi:bifunctional UDP-N-acetylglucosamine pyrophosphorylase/glucosamine-1-phosphate N-acetyltransferase